MEVRWIGGLNKGVARQAHMGQRNGGRGTALRGVVGGWGGGPGERQKASEWGEADGRSRGAPSWAYSAMNPAYNTIKRCCQTVIS